MKYRTATYINLIAACSYFSTPTLANQFGSSGQPGNDGISGRNGRSGRSLVIRANGTSAAYEISGEDGGNGNYGQHGSNASGCLQPHRPAYDVFGARGGSGGHGGSGGDGGNGGAITAYYNDIRDLRLITIRGWPGRGGSSASGGSAGNGCHCTEYHWTVTEPGGQSRNFTCRDGSHGQQGIQGRSGRNGAYGNIQIIGQMEPLLPDVTSMNIPMNKMLEVTASLGKNKWEQRQGAMQLFAAGTEINDRYNLFMGRTGIQYSFQWGVARPLADFENWVMTVKLEGADAQLYLPDNLWVTGDKLVEGNKRTYVFKSVVSKNELNNFRLSDVSGEGIEHSATIKDESRVSHLIENKVNAQLFTAENGQYKVRFDGDVPADLISVSADGLKVAVGRLGVDPDVLAYGNSAYLKLTVKRTVGNHAASYYVDSYYKIKPDLSIDEVVEVNKDTNLMIGNEVVGKILRGEKYRVAKMQQNWIGLKKLDNSEMRGWVDIMNLRPSTELTH